jgi:hypothetical protein
MCDVTDIIIIIIIITITTTTTITITTTTTDANKLERIQQKFAALCCNRFLPTVHYSCANALEQACATCGPRNGYFLARERVVVLFNIFTTMQQVLKCIKIMRRRNYI